MYFFSSFFGVVITEHEKEQVNHAMYSIAVDSIKPFGGEFGIFMLVGSSRDTICNVISLYVEFPIIGAAYECYVVILFLDISFAYF